MQPLDFAVVGIYFLVIVGIVWWSSRKQDTTADYFLAGRNVGWFVVGASILASNIGSEHIVGLAGSAAKNGLAQAHWEMQAWILLLLGWVFVPFYHRSGVYTMPEFLERRFSARSRWVLSLVSLVAYVFTKVSVTVYAGALVFRALLPDTFGSPENAFWVGAVTTVLATGIYTVLGGLRAVVYTEVLQTGLLLLGSAVITLFGLHKLGGWGALRHTLAPHAAQLALWRPNSDPSFPWLGVMIASVVIGIWYWCTDQYIVQRTLAAKSLPDARRGAIWGGFLKLWPVMIFMVPGMIGLALHEKGLLRMPVAADGSVIADAIFPTLVTTVLPVGLRGLVVGGLLSALMSSLASLFNSCATLFTVDMYEKIRPGRSEKHLVRVGRIATTVVVGLGLLWIPIMKSMAEGKSGLYDYLQNVQGFLAPPITAVFLLGLFHKRINGQGAFWGLVLGFIFGMFKLTLQTLVETGAMSATGPLGALGAWNGYYFSGALFLISVVLVVAISYATPAQPLEQIAGLTYGTRFMFRKERGAFAFAQQDRPDVAGRGQESGPTPAYAVEPRGGGVSTLAGVSPGDSPTLELEDLTQRDQIGWPDIVGTAVVIALVVAMYAYFTFWL